MQTTADASAIRDAVGRFFDRMLDDPELGRYWVGVDRSRLRRHALLFILEALGGPELYVGDVSAAHRRLGIVDRDYERVTEVLIQCLTEAEVSVDVLALARQRIGELRPLIVTA